MGKCGWRKKRYCTGSFRKDFGYKDYAEYILNVPLCFNYENGDFISTDNKTVEELYGQICFYRKGNKVYHDSRCFGCQGKNHIEIRVGIHCHILIV